MINWRFLAILGSGVGFYIIGMGFLEGILPERVQFDPSRTAVLTRHDEAPQRREAHVIRLKSNALPPHEASDAPWTVHIRAVDEALAQESIHAAERAWHEAHVAALRSRRWEGLVEVGDASLRIGEVAGSHQAFQAKARGSYWAALLHARQQGSLEGMLRTAEAFAALGDRGVATQCLRVAEGLAAQARDAQARARVQAFREQSIIRVLGAKNPHGDPF